MLPIHSVREYLKKGGNGAAIPRLFEARAGAHSGYLDNSAATSGATRPPYRVQQAETGPWPTSDFIRRIRCSVHVR